MSADLADFGYDYWPVSLQRPNAYLLETEIFSIIEYQLKCCSAWYWAACCRQGHQWLAWTDRCAPEWQLMDNTWNIRSERKNSLFDWLYYFMTLLRLRVMHALKLLLALQGTVATHKARFGGLSNVKVSLQNSSGTCLLKIIQLDGTWQTCCTQ